MEKYIVRTGALAQTNQISNLRSVMNHVILESVSPPSTVKRDQYHLPITVAEMIRDEAAKVSDINST